MIPKQAAWANAFNEIFKDLNRRELSSNAHFQFNEEFLIHKQKECAWFRCGACRRKWHSFKAYVEFTYGLKKEGKPKRRIGKVSLIPYGQKCQYCANPPSPPSTPPTPSPTTTTTATTTATATLPPSPRTTTKTAEVFLYPIFDEDTIKRTLMKVRDIVEKRFYTERPYDPVKTIHGGSTPLSRGVYNGRGSEMCGCDAIYISVGNMEISDDDDKRKRRRNRRTEIEVKSRDVRSTDTSSFAGSTDGNEVDYNEKSISEEEDGIGEGEITDGPHKTDLCEACAKGKCSQGINNRSRTTSESDVRVTTRISNPSQYPDFSTVNDELSLSKVKWHLSIKQFS